MRFDRRYDRTLIVVNAYAGGLEAQVRRSANEIEAVVYIDVSDHSSGTNISLCKFLGRSAWQRLIYQLAARGIANIAVVGGVDPATVTEMERQLLEVLCRKSVSVCYVEGPSLDTGLHESSAQLLIAQANLVCDERLLAKIADHTGPARLVSGSGEAIGLAKLDRKSVNTLVCDRDITAQLGEVERVDAVSVDSVPWYLPNMRRKVPPYWRLIRQPQDLELAAGQVMDRAQKGVLDFPARYLHPIPENTLAALVARTPITPNQITVFSGIVAFVGTYFFATQQFFTGLIIAVLAGILDGVDGKLARVKLLSSPFGDRLDHIIDVTFEFSWYIAIGWGLYQATGNSDFFTGGFLMIGIMLMNRALSGIYRVQTGREIHDHTAFDRAVRLFAGRRNIFIVVLLIGYVADQFTGAFYLMVAWGIATAIIYTLRNVMVFAKKLLPVQQ